MISYQEMTSVLKLALTQAWRKMVIVWLVVIVVFAGFILITPTQYQTTWVLLLPGTERNATVNLDDIGEARTTSRSAYGNVAISPKHTYREISLSSKVLYESARRFGVPEGSFSKPNVKLVQQTPAIRFTLKGENQQELQERAQIFHDVFMGLLDELRTNEILRQENGVQNQLKLAKERLATSQASIIDFQAQHSVLTHEDIKVRSNNLENLRHKLSLARLETSKVGSEFDHLSGLLKLSPEQALRLSLLANDPQILSLFETLNSQHAKSVELSAIAGPEYPERKILESQLTKIRADLRQRVRQDDVLASLSDTRIIELLSVKNFVGLAKLIELSIAHYGLANSIQQQETQLKLLRTELGESRQLTMQLAELERDHQIAEAIFSSALTKLDSNRFDIYASYPLTQLLSIPGSDIRKDKFAIKLLIVCGFFMSLISAFIVVMLRVRKIQIDSLMQTQGGTDEVA